jgi:hypothetical protein
LVTAGPGNDTLTLRRTAGTKADYVMDAGPGANKVTVDLSSETTADVVYMTAAAIHSNNLANGGSGNIYYRANSGTFGGGASLILGSGGDRVFLQGTQAGAPTLVQLGAGNNNVVVSSDPDPTLGQLNSFAATLTVNGTAGTNLMIVSELAKATSDTTWVTNHGIAFDAEQFLLNYMGNWSRGIQIAEGTGNDTAIVQSQLAGTPVSIFGNGGNDIFQVAVTNASAYANLLLDGGLGNSMLQLFDQSGGATGIRRFTTVGVGAIEVLYSGGATSVVNFQNLLQQFANFPLTDGTF